MSDVGDNKRPIIIIKRKKVVAGGHHGGAWKVAYADFVTAMMAFFLLMWLLGATNEKQRKAIADYFNPTITINRNSGGGGSFFGGDSPFPEESLPHNGIGATNPRPEELDGKSSRTARAEEDAKLKEAEESLFGSGGDSSFLENELRHVATRLTDEGLIIEIVDLQGEPLFVGATAEPTKIMVEISKMLVGVFNVVDNKVAYNAHTRAVPIVSRTDETWALSASRAMATRHLLEESGLDASRSQRVTGFSSREPIQHDPMSITNNRVEVILLRSDI